MSAFRIQSLLLLLATLAFESTTSAGVQPAWIRRYDAGLARVTNQVAAMALDSQQNIVIAGSSTGPGGDYDYVTLKYNSSGDLLWSARQSTTNGDDRVRDMVLDGEGNIYVTGTSVTLKYGSGGSLEWTAPFAGRGLAWSESGHLYVTGFSESDFATAKLSAAGSNEWVRFTDLFQHGYPDHSEKVAVDETGNVYVAGGGIWILDLPRVQYSKSGIISYGPEGDLRWRLGIPANFGLRFGQVTGLIWRHDQLYFCGKQADLSSFELMALSGSGDINWSQGFGLDDDEGVTALIVPSATSAYVTGRRVFGGYPAVAYATFGVDAAGAVVWRAVYNNCGGIHYHKANAIAADSEENVYVTGQSNDCSGEDTDWATIKYTAEGREQWVLRYDGAAHRTDIAQKIAVDAAGNIYVAGTETTTNGSVVLVLIKYVDLTNIVLQPSGAVLLKFFGTPGQACRFQASTDLVSWSDLGSSVVDPGGIATFLETNAPAFPTRFYRMVTP